MRERTAAAVEVPSGVGAGADAVEASRGKEQAFTARAEASHIEIFAANEVAIAVAVFA